MSLSSKAVSQAIAAQFGGCQDGDEDTPLHTAAYEGNVDVLDEILSRRPPREAIDRRNHLGCTPLRLAVTGGHTACVESLLAHGASVDTADVKGQTPLLVAVTHRYFACAQLLLRRGANPNGDAQNCSSPLGQAALHGRLDLVQLLLEHNADIVTQRQRGGHPFIVDPLVLALAYQHYDCAKLLLSAGAKPTPLLYHTLVTQHGHWRFAHLLFEFGVGLWSKNAQGQYPWEVAPRAQLLTARDWDGGELVQFLERVRAHPRSLKSCCRLCVWRRMVRLKKTTASYTCPTCQTLCDNISASSSFEHVERQKEWVMKKKEDPPPFLSLSLSLSLSH